MAKNPDPNIPVTTLAGKTRTLDDWLTHFHLCMVVLPGRPESAQYVALAERALKVFREADCKTAVLVTGNESSARKVLGPLAERYVVFVDLERALVKALGLERLPAFVHLRADTTVVDVAEGWDPDAWDRVAEGVAAAMRWTRPVYPLPGDPPAFEGWAVA
jgi:hypothetical protein